MAGWLASLGTALGAPALPDRGSILQNILHEAWIDHTPFLIVAFVFAIAIRRNAVRAGEAGRAHMRGTLLLLALHVASVPLLGALAAHSAAGYSTMRLVSITFATIAGINIALTVLFDGVLRWIKFETPKILADVVAAAAYIVAALVLLSTRGVNLSGLIATSAVLTAVIGFSLQDTLGNLMGGLALQMDKSVQPGEWIEFGGKQGRITEMRWRQTSIETRDWETIVIPNSLLAKSQITVIGRRQLAPVQVRRSMSFNVDFRYKPSEVVAVLTEALQSVPIEGVAATPAPDCVLSNMQQSFNTYSVRYYLADFARWEAVDSIVRTRIYFALQRADIPLGIPAQAVFVTSETEERKQRKRAGRLEDRRQALRSVELFHGLDDADIDALAQSLRYAPFSQGEVLTRQGEPGHELYLITRGQVAIQVNVDGRPHEVARLDPGAFFGERSLMTGARRSATTVALTDVVCYLLDKDSLEPILRRRPELAEELAETLARRESELDSVRKDADEVTRSRRLQTEKSHLLHKIRGFFGI